MMWFGQGDLVETGNTREEGSIIMTIGNAGEMNGGSISHDELQKKIIIRKVIFRDLASFSS